VPTADWDCRLSITSAEIRSPVISFPLWASDLFSVMPIQESAIANLNRQSQSAISIRQSQSPISIANLNRQSPTGNP
jgi:hypothetical protein